jgi:hypothetical protein
MHWLELPTSKEDLIYEHTQVQGNKSAQPLLLYRPAMSLEQALDWTIGFLQSVHLEKP